MVTRWLRVRAPFAAFRWMQAGDYRASSPIIPPSAAWGLILNVAAIETRQPGGGVVTAIREDAPRLCLALGVVREPERSTLYQQLHKYRVGSDERTKTLAERTHGAKSWIAPVRREVLLDLDCVIGVRADDTALLERVESGIEGAFAEERYGLPFAGDNNFLFDRIDVVPEAPACRWYERIQRHTGPRKGSCRLTVAIDRVDASRTVTGLYAPTINASATPPEAAWTWVPG